MASIRKRVWYAKGTKRGRGPSRREAWLVDYITPEGKRKARTFQRRKDAVHFRKSINNEIRREKVSVVVALFMLWVLTELIEQRR